MAEIQVALPVMLHARPAALVAAFAAKSPVPLQIGVGGRVVPAKSLISLLSLGAKQGTVVTARAEGENADEAVRGFAEFLGALTE